MENTQIVYEFMLTWHFVKISKFWVCLVDSLEQWVTSLSKAPILLSQQNLGERQKLRQIWQHLAQVKLLHGRWLIGHKFSLHGTG